MAPLFGSGFGRLAASGVTAAIPDSIGHTLLVGTQTGSGSNGIYSYAWDAEAGKLRLLGLSATTPMPTFLATSPDKRFLFVANETDDFDGVHSGGVSSFRVPGHAGQVPQLQAINSAVAGGGGTCYVGLDRTGGVLLCANYGGGSASSFKVSKTGNISPTVSHFQYSGHGPNPERQEAPHVHRATASPGNRFALFNDLGLDVIHIYKMDAATAELTPHEPAAWHAPSGSGPRALQFHPSGKWAYCVTEMGSTVMVMDWDEERGTLTTKDQISLVPEGFHGRSQASELALDRMGKFLYVADRFYDGLYSFIVDTETGELHDMVRMPIAGKTPRYITLDPTERWLLTADQDSNSIEVFPRDQKTGRLGARAAVVSQTKPQCLVFV